VSVWLSASVTHITVLLWVNRVRATAQLQVAVTVCLYSRQLMWEFKMMYPPVSHWSHHTHTHYVPTASCVGDSWRTAEESNNQSETCEMAADVSSPPMRWDMLKQRPETEGQDLKVTTPGSLHWSWCSTVSFHMLCWKHHEHRRAHTTGAGYEPQLLKWEKKKTKKRRWIPVELRRTSSGNKVLLFC